MGLADRRRARGKVRRVVRTVKREMMKMLNLRWALANCLIGIKQRKWAKMGVVSKKEIVDVTRMDNLRASHPKGRGPRIESS